jgi:glycosyltransferase involved in cell wall biosynthesis
MKILHITTNAGGGAGRAALRLHHSLLKKGIESHILFLKDKVEGIQNAHCYADYENKLFFKFKDSFHRLQSKIASGFDKYQAFSLAKTPFDLLKVPIVSAADVIHLHWVTKFLDYKSFFKKIGKPVVWTLHDMLPFSPGYHYLFGFNLAKFEHKLNANLAIKKNALKDFDQLSIVAPTQWLLNLSAKSELFSKYPHRVIRNLLDRAVFYQRPDTAALRAKFGFKSNDKIVLYVAEDINDRRKGIDLFVSITDRLLEKNYKILLIGSGEFEKKDANIIPLGKISDDQTLAAMYSIADVFVISSREDNYPNTVLESLACATPVVGFDNSGIAEMIQHEKTGFVAKAFNTEEILEGIGFCLQNHSTMSENAKKIIHEVCDEDRICSQFCDLYQEMIQKTKA